MLNGDGNENSSKINRSYEPKHKFARAANFFEHSFAIVVQDYSAVLHHLNVKRFSYTLFFYGIVVSAHQMFCCLCSRCLFFFFL